MVSTKACTACGVVFERTAENFYVNRVTRDGLNSRCKGCQVAANTEYKRLTRLGVRRVERTCVVCSASYWVDRKRAPGRQATACSEECRGERRRRLETESRVSKAVREPRVCPICSSPYVSRTAADRHCGSKRCAARLSLLRKYGLNPTEFDALLDRQGNGCAVCRVPFGEHQRGPQIDHCHETGQVRGLLCTSCNIGLGHTKDDPALQFEFSLYLARATFDLRDLCLQ